MVLKQYQQNTLDILKKFFERCRVVEHRKAFRAIISEPEVKARLGTLDEDYKVWDGIPNTPRICIKVPTGGGKTIIAAHAIKIISETWLSRDYPVVLWFCPSDAIRKQTAEALKNPRHPYREALDGQFGGHVRVFDLDDKFNIRPQDVEDNVCIVVSTIQSFVKENTTKYNVYKDNENFQEHFARMYSTAGMERKEDSSRVKYSFANLLFFHKPIMIVDEAHNAVTDLTATTQSRISPSAIIELTATPRKANNTLYNVSATELKEEEMIKLPIALVEHWSWEQMIDEAIAKRAELEKIAERDKDYIRPILLFQAQNKDGELNVDALKAHLVDTANIPENEIAIATGEQHELDNINVFDKSCSIRYIITVEALKEGWDCSFAYVLCSLANVRSSTSVEQLLGRVMRMPYARAREKAALNKAYAYVLSSKFGEAAEALVEKLVKKGFDDNEAMATIEQLPTKSLFGQDINKIELEKPLPAKDIPASMTQAGKFLILTRETTEEDIEIVCKVATEVDSFKIKQVFTAFKSSESVPSPAKSGEKFSVPCLMVDVDGKLVHATPDIIFEQFDWDIEKFVSPKLETDEFNIEAQGRGFIITIDNEKLQYAIDTEQSSVSVANVGDLPVQRLVDWLDIRLHQDDITQAKMRSWLKQVVDHLTEAKDVNLTTANIAKYALKDKLATKISLARSKAKDESFAIFMREGKGAIDFNIAVEFTENTYEDQLSYHGKFKFAKHYTSRVPQIDGNGTGEEFGCARAIDSLGEVKYWIRNVAKHPYSFSLPTATGNFYPDFVALLDDGRVLVVEYKGLHLIDSKNTKEKVQIGALWEEKMQGKGLFLIAESSSKDGLNVAEQIKAKIRIDK
ncbi:DEAD/DEAH box helicase family protein [Deferribacterales bacterium RsTz2092]|nr:type III restriction endonuclease [Deferribacterales bacterium]